MEKKIVQTAGRTQLGDFAPLFAEANDDFLLARCGTTPVWMSKRAALLR